MEVAFEDVAKDLFWAETLQVLFFSDARELPDACKDFGSVIEERACLHHIGVLSLIGRYLQLTSDLVILVSWSEHWRVKCSIDCHLYSEHDIENHVEVVMSEVYCVLGDWLINLSLIFSDTSFK